MATRGIVRSESLKSATLCITAALALVASASAQDQASFEAGKKFGTDFGVYWSNGGSVGHPLASVMPTIADGQWKQHGRGDEASWKKGFLAGFDIGLIRGTAGETPPIKAKDKAAYDAGYLAGYISAHLIGDRRDLMHRRCDEIIARRHYDKASFDEGFVVGTGAADKTSALGSH